MGTYQRIFTEILRGKLIILHITFLLPEIGAIKGSTILRYLRTMESCAQKMFFLVKRFYCVYNNKHNIHVNEQYM